MNIFLIALYPNSKFPLIGESLGICAISGYMKKRYGDDVSVFLYDQQSDSTETIINDIITYKPDIIGLSVKVFTFTKFIELYQILKKKKPNSYTPLIVLGNSVAHFSGEKILNEYGFHDVIISLGEGEVSFPYLYEYKKGSADLHDIPNIMYYNYKTKEVIRTKYEYLNKDFIPIADRFFSKTFQERGGEIYIESSRGCAYCSCGICECRDFLGSSNIDFRWRDKPISSVVSELGLLQRIGITAVNFADEDFIGPDLYGIERAINLSKEIIRNNIQVQFRINARVKSIVNLHDTNETASIKSEMLDILKAAGLVKIFLGFESGVQTQLNRYGKGFLLEEFLSAKKVLDKKGIDYELGYIPIDPLMTLEELHESLLFIKTHNCIPHISSIYKELRIQSGNKTYLNKVRLYEQQNNKHLINELKIDDQQYEIVHYADERIERIVKHMAPYISNRYKLYYQFRRDTQLTPEANQSRLQFQIMKLIKQSDYRLMVSIVESINRNKSDEYLSELIQNHQKELSELINKSTF